MYEAWQLFNELNLHEVTRLVFAGAMLIAMVIDCVVGWPSRMFDQIGHPVSWLGHFIDSLDRRWNHEENTETLRRTAGIVTAVAVTGVTAAIAAVVQLLLPSGWAGIVLTGVVAWPFLAPRSLFEHVAAVHRPLTEGDLASARAAVAMIVGRDTSHLDEAGIARAALESLGENTSDGVVAPLFWGVLLGLPGLAAYKAINTLDSMIGHRTERHEAFGWASAKIDDIANFIPARLTGVVFAMVSGRPRTAMICMMRDAGKHRSPNAGWPEAALAGGLDVRLSGPRDYGGQSSREPWLNGTGRDPAAGDIKLGLQLYTLAMLVCGAALILVFVFTINQGI